MKIAERDAFHHAIKILLGEIRDSEVMHGGDLSGRAVSCSLPISSSSLKGVKFGVPISDNEVNILAALADQNVIHSKRLPVRGHPEIPSETVLFTFSSQIPDRVKIAAISYRFQQSIPTPFRCKKCWRLGHSTSRCNSPTDCCKNCGKSHASDFTCSTMCINCKGLSHKADSEKCPEYLEMKTILKISVIQGISVKEARARHNRSYSHAVQTSKRNPVRPAPSPPPKDKNAPQLAALQAELKFVRDITIPSMNDSIRNLTLDLAATKKNYRISTRASIP
ncbi:hypothetical protein GHT06_016990 [Daphnia sinensis]|uniref:Uncharacterized protein n=1 Tax=Daphnia sinensis TaxID=1820382 RepID=A0AAD5KP99_9CRUS|nr:hypothetical protein GHT06_016990 [Daphnia sinensis]